jgi:hypothetical protein
MGAGAFFGGAPAIVKAPIFGGKRGTSSAKVFLGLGFVSGVVWQVLRFIRRIDETEERRRK